MRMPSVSKIVFAPPRCSASCARTRSGERTVLQHRQVALALVTVPPETPLSFFGSNISNSTCGGTPFDRIILYRSARLRFGFLHSQKERMRGISAPQLGDSH